MAGAAQLGLGKGFEQQIKLFGGNAGACVGDGEPQPAGGWVGCGWGASAGVGLGEVEGGRLRYEAPPAPLL